MYTSWDIKNVLMMHIFPVILNFFFPCGNKSFDGLYSLCPVVFNTWSAFIITKIYSKNVQFLLTSKFKTRFQTWFCFYFQATWFLISFRLFSARKFEENLLWWTVHGTYLGRFAKTMLYRRHTRQSSLQLPNLHCSQCSSSWFLWYLCNLLF